MNPISVRYEADSGRYILIAGERRFRAAQLAGLERVPVIVRIDLSADETAILAMQLVENLQREDLTVVERAQAIAVLKDSYGLSVREIGSKLGVSKSMVQRSLEILSLPEDLLEALRNGASESKVILLAQVDDRDLRATYLKDLEFLTRAQLHSDLQKRSRIKKPAKELAEEDAETGDPEDRRITDEIQQSLGLKVKLLRTSGANERGKLVIEFYSDEDLQELFRRLVQDD
jgi:ParB family chromosome partitioning protein